MTTPHIPARTGEKSPSTFRRSRTGRAVITSGSFLVVIWVLMLINALSMLCPFSPEDKQALLEAPSLTTRRETIITLLEYALHSGRDAGDFMQ